ncbi:MAG: hypothetical protein ACD_42C00324G0003 [uncultured bacterium]|nr:MAG: hypothetical protein ACD_42C00324G0003 [uncultured bacterium]OGT33157.1 MAG: hypothetical protein A3C44_06170 [Gammaproteobacteria bacterium RIFCSPHIGHO2_02_FULL_39_13]OGT49263.1 MAG: hypothetical protein A3E53_07370 [Gammaproteobacteria bacterium RIFCSPHIGHO2_12_FULL_39_24]
MQRQFQQEGHLTTEQIRELQHAIFNHEAVQVAYRHYIQVVAETEKKKVKTNEHTTKEAHFHYAATIRNVQEDLHVVAAQRIAAMQAARYHQLNADPSLAGNRAVALQNPESITSQQMIEAAATEAPILSEQLQQKTNAMQPDAETTQVSTPTPARAVAEEVAEVSAIRALIDGKMEQAEKKIADSFHNKTGLEKEIETDIKHNEKKEERSPFSISTLTKLVPKD